MAKELRTVLRRMPAERRERIEKRAEELATLADLRRTMARTQAELASELAVGQDTVSRIERGGDMLVSTLRRHVEALGGTLELVARFPGRPPFLIARVGGREEQGKK